MGEGAARDAGYSEVWSLGKLEGGARYSLIGRLDSEGRGQEAAGPSWGGVAFAESKSVGWAAEHSQEKCRPALHLAVRAPASWACTGIRLQSWGRV